MLALMNGARSLSAHETEIVPEGFEGEPFPFEGDGGSLPPVCQEIHRKQYFRRYLRLRPVSWVISSRIFDLSFLPDL
jgi:hypothetical protein